MTLAFATKTQLSRLAGRCVDLDYAISRRRQRYVLCYHRVLPPDQARDDHVHDAMWISPQTFDAQVRWMLEVGDIVDYRRILDIETPSDRPMFCITFDDGWRDNYQHAFAVLKRYNVPCLIFLATAAIDSGEMFWTEDLLIKTHCALRAGAADKVISTLKQLAVTESGQQTARLKHPIAHAEYFVESLKWVSAAERQHRLAEYYRRIGTDPAPLQGHIMSWDEVREMYACGVDFGSHTHTHKILTMASPEEIEQELKSSKEILTSQLQGEVDTFCYPNASYNGSEGAMLAKYGYQFGFRIDNLSMQHYTDPYYVPRFIVYEQIGGNNDYFKLRLLEVPGYKGS